MIVVLLFALGCAVVGVDAQLGVTTCTFATQANCPNFLANSFCDLTAGVCDCPAIAGYVDDGSGVACVYDCTNSLAAPTNGAVDTTAGTYTGDVATFSCDNGYKVTGSSTSTCVADIGWDNTATTCEPGVLGDDCSANIFLCNNVAFGTCDFSNCVCQNGYEDDGTGTACTEINECAVNPCQNGGSCTDAVASYSCACVAGYQGDDCETDIDDCATSPCQNGGTCIDGVNSYTCTCVAGYDGNDCQNNIDECAASPCQNGGNCLDGVNSYLCTCVAGYDGNDCENNIDDCSPDPCQNGATCVDGVADYTCTCVAGYEDKNCQTNIDECASSTCQNGATCVDGINQYTCTCVAGYDGTFCENNIDECATDNCQNGATCVDGVNTYTCLCVAGYDGTFCNNDIDDCDPSPCQNGATCIDDVNDYSCTCVDGYTDKNCQTNIDECAANPCLNGATCVDAINDYTCNCVAGYEDKNCQTDIDECLTNNCQNGATCVDSVNDYTCVCASGYDGIFCQNDIDECAISNNCQNGAGCIDGVYSYTCDCLNGYDGTFCQNNINECNVNLCVNGATCVDGIDGYTCDCLDGFEGTYCSIDVDECGSSLCENGATCVDGINQYTCTCVAGYDGTLCDNNIDECDPDPCLNGGTCTDGIDQYTCTCVDGYVGTNCETNVDECAADPCQNGATCVDGINDYTCTCLPGYSSKTCGINIDECNSAPCQNGATCVDGIDDYACTCVPGYDGGDCENNIDECVGHTCQNGATCVDGVNLYTCSCVPGYDGSSCANNIDECSSHSCLNGATCDDGINEYTCICVTGYQGDFCETDINECSPSPCMNGGSCTDLVNGYTCACTSGFTGAQCRAGELDDDCSVRSDVCSNIAHAECDGLVCTCVTGFEEDAASPGTCTRVDCGTLVPPTNGLVDDNEGVVYESKVYFSCDPGYTLDGVTFLTCQSDASWDGTAPTCNIMDCGTLPTPYKGNLTYTPNTFYNGKAEFACYTGYSLVGSASRTCTDSGVWDGLSPVCEIKDCGSLAAPTNGIIDQTDGTIYESITYFQCDNGYTLNGATSLTCESDGSWNGFKPTCDIKDCGILTDPVNGLVSEDGTVYLSTATYTCNTGYTLSGSSVRTCQASGSWNSVDPLCEINDCGTLNNPDDGNVDISSGTTFGEEAEYSCDPGFEINGVTKRTCLSDGTWSTVPPVCDRIDCGYLPSPTNGVADLTGGSLFEATAHFTCNTGYTLTGDISRYCQDTGAWDNASPTCIIKDCGTLSDPVNGYVLTVFGTTFNQTADYTCATGYQVNGVSSRTCLSTGLWGASEPTCVIIDCGPVANISNGNIGYSNGYIYESTVTYTCIDGYEVTGFATRVCEATGSWSNNQPSCTILDCDSPTTISNGVFKVPSGSQVGDVAIYECNSGYGLVGNAEVPCESTGFWGTIPECRLDCGTPIAVTNGAVSYPDGSLVGATATYTCTDGYYISGDSVVTCESTGSWTNEPFCFIIHRNYDEACSVTDQCLTIDSSCRDNGAGEDRCLCSLTGQFYDSSIDQCLADCGGLTAPTNGLVTLPEVYSAGQIAVYSCDRGFALSGPAIRTCLSTGSWNGSAPQCVAGCPDPDAPSDGNVDISQGTASGDTIVYSCNVGYSLLGASERQCNSDGTWNGNAPTCAIECPKLNDIEYGWVDMALGRYEGSKAVYVCMNNYAVVGESTRTCQSTGLWDGVQPECVFAIFPDVLLVFGSLFVFLVLVDIAIIAFCVYIKYCRKEKEERDPNYPEVLDEEEETGVPPPAFIEPSKEYKQKKVMEKERERKSKFAKVMPETKREILRMDEHPRPKPGPNVKVKRNANFGGFDKEAFFKKFTSKRNKESKSDRDKIQPGPDSERSRPELHLTGLDDINVPPNSVQQQAMHELRAETTHHLPNEELIRDGGYGTANSDESNARIIDEDQLSLDDLTPANHFPETSSITPKESKRHGEEYSQKFKGRIPLPQVSDTVVNVEKETEKNYNDRERKHMKNSVLTYSPIMKHK